MRHLMIVFLAAATTAAALLPGTAAAQNPSWTQWNVSTPPARSSHAWAFDEARGGFVLFGGYDGSGRYGDTWTWDGASWQSRTGPGPSPRYDHAMAYDRARGRVVLFGGYDAGPTNNGRAGDTWEWDGLGWQQRASSGPAPRRGHAMAYDDFRGVTVLFGGSNAANLGDTWEWDGFGWQQRASSGPAARFDHAMAFDPEQQRVLLFGGSGTALLADLWEWDGTAWREIVTSGPGIRYGHAMAADARRHTIVLVGGFNGGSSYLDDVWEWNGAEWLTAGTMTFPARRKFTLGFDPQRQRIELHGGHVSGNLMRDDFWEWNGVGTWSSFGQGCGSPPLALRHDATTRPVLGTSARLLLDHVPSSLCFLGAGVSNTAYGSWTLPHSLASFGLPGCALLQSLDIHVLGVTHLAPAAAECVLALPPAIALDGLPLYWQAWCFAPGANPGGVAVSNGVYWLLGSS